MNELTVTANVTAKPGKEAETEKELRALIKETHKEDGCLRCTLHKSVKEPGQFLIVAKWSSMEALNQHFKSAHILHFMKITTEILVSPPDIKLFQPLPEGLPGKGTL